MIINDGREIIINAFKDKIFPLSFEGFPEYGGRGEDEDKIFTPKQVTPRDEVSDFGIKEILEDKKTDTTDMPDSKTEQSVEERKKTRSKRLKNINFTKNA